MSNAPGFVCAFRGRRDDYQVPLALAEGGLLARWVTDFYATRSISSLSGVLPSRLRDRIRFRRKAGFPDDAVCQVPWIAVTEFMARNNPQRIVALRDKHDDFISLRAAEVARKTHTNLFLYSSNAYPAFTARYDHRPIRILFQYHPHYSMEHELLLEDDRRWPKRCRSHYEDQRTVVRRQRRKSDSAWQEADHIICASSFTASSLVAAGADANRMSIIPYGVESLSRVAGQTRQQDDTFRVLYVGSGLQRKGLHHLIEAWRQAKLPEDATLKIVARTLDRSLIDTADLPRGVEWVAGLSRDELAKAYQQATLFCMPSLVEGFGQVFVEALSEGLPVLGTSHTCLPDVGDEGDGVFLAAAGDVEDLARQLERTSVLLVGNEQIRTAARRAAQRLDWGTFRRKIIQTCSVISG